MAIVITREWLIDTVERTFLGPDEQTSVGGVPMSAADAALIYSNLKGPPIDSRGALDFAGHSALAKRLAAAVGAFDAAHAVTTRLMVAPARDEDAEVSSEPQPTPGCSAELLRAALAEQNAASAELGAARQAVNDVVAAALARQETVRTSARLDTRLA